MGASHSSSNNNSNKSSSTSSAKQHQKTTTSTSSKNNTKYPLVGSNDIMKRKQHGTSDAPVQEELRWNVSRKKADQICNYNRHFAEPSGSAFKNQHYLNEFQNAKQKGEPMQFYDSVTRALLFEAASKSRSHDAFDRESRRHGWPSFRDDEVNWDHVRCLKNGECVSVTGTHLGHNLPDRNGNRYCINLVSIAGYPLEHHVKE